ncbi:MAG: hypothetical protein Ct9H90mP16_19800 [Candidatus Poseidoniales archaeon]|nr:MAG: hypothetical protein Ct9H90mP16_19800 [Candidatus Poseidoniales archaeon]
MVLTRDLRTLQRGKLLWFVTRTGTGNLQDVSISTGIVEHRRVTMPGFLVPKLAGVEGVFAVFEDRTGPTCGCTSR